MYYNMPINNDLIRLWQLQQALTNMDGTTGQEFDTVEYMALKDNLRKEIKMLAKNIDLTAKALLARNGTLNPI